VIAEENAAEMSSTAVMEKGIPRTDESGDRNLVLIVDDEESVVGALVEFFSMRGYEVESAVTARQALGLIHEKRFGIVICDLRLPGMNGVELLDHVVEANPETVFIIMTGYASVQSAVEAMKRGAYDYVVKPFSMYELEKTVRLGLEKQKLAHENLELSHLMRKLIEIDQIKSNIISTVSHEFRTPLMSLKGYLAMLSGLLEKDNGLERNEGKWLRGMKDNLGRLEMLILNLLLMTEANAGDLLITGESVNVAAVVKESLSRVGPLTKSKDIRVSVLGDDDCPVRGDTEKLGVAVTNLIENAVKFNLDSGRIDIAISQTTDPDGFRISILDTGIGIPEDKINSIFNSFTQADMTHTRRFAGVGLGLSVAKAIIEAHGGSIDVTSKPGQGSTFFVWLPRGNEGDHGPNRKENH
jgi:two-component system sensor histidine kinase/response regulator